jgi:hypothetical protein
LVVDAPVNEKAEALVAEPFEAVRLVAGGLLAVGDTGTGDEEREK